MNSTNDNSRGSVDIFSTEAFLAARIAAAVEAAGVARME